jgi:GNAT superfamily N-acetyltransferase
VFLEDLFVTQAARGKGVGRRPMTRLAAIAVERGWERIDFLCLTGIGTSSAGWDG